MLASSLFVLWVTATAALNVQYEKHAQERLRHQRASLVMRALFHDSMNGLAHAYNRGMEATLDQTGYEQSLGAPAMTAFLLRYMESQGLTPTNTGDFAGMRMYYDGSCIKYAFHKMETEIAVKPFQESCHGTWLAPTRSFAAGSPISHKQSLIFRLREKVELYAAAYTAAQKWAFAKVHDDAVGLLTHFVHDLAVGLRGVIRDFARLRSFVVDFVHRPTSVKEPLENLVELLRLQGQMNRSFVELPTPRSKNFVVETDADELPAWKSFKPGGIGSTAPLNDAGYAEVVFHGGTPEMFYFAQRVAAANNLRITDLSKLAAFVPWYSGACTKQSYDALVSELKNIVVRGEPCGGGWVEKAPQLLLSTTNATYGDLRLLSRAESQAVAAIRALLGSATSSAAEGYYRGMLATLDQHGYEQCMGNEAMTAFVLRYLAQLNLEITKVGSLQGFVMYYDGMCAKKAYDKLKDELANMTYRIPCHGGWTVSKSELLAQKGVVSHEQLRALRFKENVTAQAAAYAVAARFTESSRSVANVRKFVQEFVAEMQGEILNQSQFEGFVDEYIARSKGAADPLGMLLNALHDNSESAGAAVKMPKALSRSVAAEGREEEIDWAQFGTSGLGATAPLNEAGFYLVAKLQDNEQMFAFASRAARANNLTIASNKSLMYFVPWYNGLCANQTYLALVSELENQVERKPVCGGGWVLRQASAF